MAMNGDIEDMHRRIFAAMLTHLDASVGQILQAIEAEGLTEETILVFLSDNGGPTREFTSSNAPFRGEKGQMYEGGSSGVNGHDVVGSSNRQSHL